MSDQLRGQGILPAPVWRRAGDFVFISSLYPLDADGLIVRTPGPFEYAGPSEMAAQTRSVLSALDEVLVSAGTCAANLLRVEVHLAAAGDFFEFKLVWFEWFPEDPPARTTIVVGPEHIADGCRLNLHAVALAGDAEARREVVRVPDLPDPMPAEHAPLAVKAAPFVFISGFCATDFQTGIAVKRTPGFPNYGSDAELQAHSIVQRLARIAEAAGSGLGEMVKVQFYEPDLSTFHDVDGVWGSLVGVPPTRSSMACRGLLVPGALFAPNVLLLVPDAEHRKQETRLGIRWHPVDVRKVNFSPGIVAGRWLFTAGQVPLPDIATPVWVGAPAGLPNHFSDVEIQTEFTMELLAEQLTANGYSLDDVVDARVYLTEPQRDFRGFHRAWRRIFPDPGRGPAMSLIPSRQANGDTGILFPGPVVEIDLTSCREGPEPRP